jgi:hypothetical protein
MNFKMNSRGLTLTYIIFWRKSHQFDSKVKTGNRSHCYRRAGKKNFHDMSLLTSGGLAPIAISNLSLLASVVEF